MMATVLTLAKLKAQIWSHSHNPKRARRSGVKMSEYEMQEEVIQRCDEKAVEQPLWGEVLAIPNGQYRRGQRMEPGLRSGVPDLAIFVARHRKHGCFIELKVSPYKQSENQLLWQKRLRSRGFMSECIWDDPLKVIDFIDWYLFR
jgi:hypothetical protein